MESFRKDRPLVESIACATRGKHARLNKLIVARLPLALPPRASDPAPYLSGLLHITPIYATFEKSWRDILDAPPVKSSTGTPPSRCVPDMPFPAPDSPLSPEHQNPRLHNPPVCCGMRSMLECLYLPGLMRSERLREDIKAMTGWSDHTVEEQLQAVSETGYLSEFISHIKRAVVNKPHVLLAYSYIMYMALFAGGRFIRATLETAGEAFWDTQPSPAKPTLRASQNKLETEHKSDASSSLGSMPLSFFHFDTPFDGEDLKNEYKQRLLDLEGMLTSREKHDIVQEAICIFENMTLLVSQLDTVCAEPEEVDHAPERSDSLASLASLLKDSISSRFRDSVAVTKERRNRASPKRSSGHEDHCKMTKNTEACNNSIKDPHKTPMPQPRHNDHPTSVERGIDLCPAMSKSIRFDETSLYAGSGQKRSRALSLDLAECFKLASKRLQEADVMNLVLAAAFGAMILGAILMSRRITIEGAKQSLE